MCAECSLSASLFSPRRLRSPRSRRSVAHRPFAPPARQPALHQRNCEAVRSPASYGHRPSAVHVHARGPGRWRSSSGLDSARAARAASARQARMGQGCCAWVESVMGGAGFRCRWPDDQGARKWREEAAAGLRRPAVRAARTTLCNVCCAPRLWTPGPARCKQFARQRSCLRAAGVGAWVQYGARHRW